MTLTMICGRNLISNGEQMNLFPPLQLINLLSLSWPTLLFLSPNGTPFYLVMGEGHYEETELIVGTSLEYFRDANQISPRSIPIKPFATPANPFELKFPSKIQCSNYDASETMETLYALSDSGNHRIIIFNSNGNVLHQIGQCGVAGSDDGNFDEAKFNCPQGKLDKFSLRPRRGHFQF